MVKLLLRDILLQNYCLFFFLLLIRSNNLILRTKIRVQSNQGYSDISIDEEEGEDQLHYLSLLKRTMTRYYHYKISLSIPDLEKQQTLTMYHYLQYNDAFALSDLENKKWSPYQL